MQLSECFQNFHLHPAMEDSHTQLTGWKRILKPNHCQSFILLLVPIVPPSTPYSSFTRIIRLLKLIRPLTFYAIFDILHFSYSLSLQLMFYFERIIINFENNNTPVPLTNKKPKCVKFIMVANTYPLLLALKCESFLCAHRTPFFYTFTL